MSNDAEPSQTRGISLELAHEIRKDKAIIDFQEQGRKLTMVLERVKASERWVSQPRELDVNPIGIGITYSSSHENHEDRGIRGRDHPRDNLSNLKVEAPELDGNLKPKNYIN